MSSSHRDQSKLAHFQQHSTRALGPVGQTNKVKARELKAIQKDYQQIKSAQEHQQHSKRKQQQQTNNNNSNGGSGGNAAGGCSMTNCEDSREERKIRRLLEIFEKQQMLEEKKRKGKQRNLGESKSSTGKVGQGGSRDGSQAGDGGVDSEGIEQSSASKKIRKMSDAHVDSQSSESNAMVGQGSRIRGARCVSRGGKSRGGGRGRGFSGNGRGRRRRGTHFTRRRTISREQRIDRIVSESEDSQGSNDGDSSDESGEDKSKQSYASQDSSSKKQSESNEESKSNKSESKLTKTREKKAIRSVQSNTSSDNSIDQSNTKPIAQLESNGKKPVPTKPKVPTHPKQDDKPSTDQPKQPHNSNDKKKPNSNRVQASQNESKPPLSKQSSQHHQHQPTNNTSPSPVVQQNKQPGRNPASTIQQPQHQHKPAASNPVNKEEKDGLERDAEILFGERVPQSNNTQSSVAPKSIPKSSPQDQQLIGQKRPRVTTTTSSQKSGSPKITSSDQHDKEIKMLALEGVKSKISGSGQLMNVKNIDQPQKREKGGVGTIGKLGQQNQNIRQQVQGTVKQGMTPSSQTKPISSQTQPTKEQSNTQAKTSQQSSNLSQTQPKTAQNSQKGTTSNLQVNKPQVVQDKLLGAPTQRDKQLIQTKLTPSSLQTAHTKPQQNHSKPSQTNSATPQTSQLKNVKSTTKDNNGIVNGKKAQCDEQNDQSTIPILTQNRTHPQSETFTKPETHKQPPTHNQSQTQNPPNQTKAPMPTTPSQTCQHPTQPCKPNTPIQPIPSSSSSNKTAAQLRAQAIIEATKKFQLKHFNNNTSNHHQQQSQEQVQQQQQQLAKVNESKSDIMQQNPELQEKEEAAEVRSGGKLKPWAGEYCQAQGAQGQESSKSNLSPNQIMQQAERGDQQESDLNNQVQDEAGDQKLNDADEEMRGEESRLEENEANGEGFNDIPCLPNEALAHMSPIDQKVAMQQYSSWLQNQGRFNINQIMMNQQLQFQQQQAIQMAQLYPYQFPNSQAALSYIQQAQIQQFQKEMFLKKQHLQMMHEKQQFQSNLAMQQQQQNRLGNQGEDAEKEKYKSEGGKKENVGKKVQQSVSQPQLQAPLACGGIQPMMTDNRLMPYPNYLRELQKLQYQQPRSVGQAQTTGSNQTAQSQPNQSDAQSQQQQQQHFCVFAQTKDKIVKEIELMRDHVMRTQTALDFYRHCDQMITDLHKNFGI